ncbi:MAG: DMT family transporter [bacterium]|nr:DMT family transporter [bacterium]
MTDRLKGHLALVLVQFCFGLFPVFGALAMRPQTGFSPFTVATFRIVTGAVALALLARVHAGRWSWPRREDRGRLLVCALTGIVLNQGLYLSGLARSNATNAGLMMCLIPVFTFALAVLARQERFRPVRALGVLIALGGTLPLVFARGEAQLLGEYGVGNLLMALNTLCYAVFLVLSKPLTARYSPLMVIAWCYVGSLWAAPVFAWGESVAPAETGDFAMWASLAFVLVFPTVVGYYLNVYALARVRASTTAMYIYFQPLISGLGGAWILGERPGPGTLVSAVALFAGLALVMRREPRIEPAAPEPEHARA